MPSVPELPGELCVLRAVQRSDVDARRAAADLSAEEGEAWFADVSAEPHEWIIAEGGEPRGQIRLHTIEGTEAFLAIGLWRPEWLGRGLGSDAIRTLCAWAREEPLGLARVKVHVAAFNDRAVAAYARAGFARIDTNALRVAGRTDDEIVMALDLDGVA